MARGRAFWVIAHRWAGLTIALFLTVAGATGMILPWEEELTRASRPDLAFVSPPHADMPVLDGVTLAERVMRQTGGTVSFLPLRVEPGHAAAMFVGPRAGGPPLGYDSVWADPYTGAVRLRFRYGVLADGTQNIVPFLYRLHYSLALGSTGLLLFGIAALVWTIDCFVGFYLTLPVRTKSAAALRATPRIAVRQGGLAGWWGRWRPSWTVRRRTSAYKLNFDLHRAGGLWLWPLLLVFAWSSVGFNLPVVHRPVMQALGASPAFESAALPAPLPDPPLSLRAARDIGRTLIAAEGRRAGFAWQADGNLFYRAGTGVYLYSARTSADPSHDEAQTRVWFDARDGRLLHFEPAQGRTNADTAMRWFDMLHMAQVFGVPYRVFVTVLGGLVVMLSVTGIVIWMKKRSARILGRRRPARRAGGGLAPLPAE